MRRRGSGTVVRPLVSHSCGSGSNIGLDVMCDLSLLLIAVLIPSGFLRVLRLSPSSIIQFDLEEHFLTDYRGVLRVT